MARWIFVLTLTGLIALAYPGSTMAQDGFVPPEEPLLQGIVAEETSGQPIAGATITLLEADLEARSDADGTFAFQDAPLGPVTVRIEAPGYVTMVEEVHPSEEAFVFVQAYLPELSATLAELLVAPEGEEAAAGGFERSAADLVLRRVLGTRRGSGLLDETEEVIRLRGVSSLSQLGEPTVFIDGARMSGGLGRALDVLRQMPAKDVADVTIVRGPATAEHTFGADGAIHVETRSGPDR